MALIRRAYISGVSLYDDDDEQGERRKEVNRTRGRDVRETERERGGGKSVISLLLSKFLKPGNGGRGPQRRRDAPHSREHSFFGDEEGYPSLALALALALGRGCSGVRNEIYEGPLFRHLEHGDRTEG